MMNGGFCDGETAQLVVDLQSNKLVSDGEVDIPTEHRREIPSPFAFLSNIQIH